jgi:processive 1,2-diacylglycerol beta-glucosyltransferase
MRRILVLSVSAGSGHVRAAQALVAAGSEIKDLEIRHVDVLELVAASFRKLYGESYLKLVESHPHLWAWLYDKSDRTPRDAWLSRLRRAIERLNTRKLHALLAEFAPDAVICTHFLPAELLGREIAQHALNVPVYVQVTDFDLHRLWVQDGMSGYFVASDEVAFRLRDYRPQQRGIAVTGIPIAPVFATDFDRKQCAAEIGADPKLKTVLLMTGGAGIASGGAMVERMLALDADFQIIALAGRNTSLLAQYQQLAERYSRRLIPMGFTTTVERVMACADIAVTKPGGLSTSECLASRLPMILIAPIPGQEERNASHLVEEGAALLALDAPALEFRLRRLLANPALPDKLRERCSAIRRPSAARDVLEIVIENLRSGSQEAT